jgi:hypothetical protein
VNLVRCGDVTDDGRTDALCAVASGGTAATDPNCCPSSFRLTRYRWFGNGFSAGKAKKLENAPRRFYRP